MGSALVNKAVKVFVFIEVSIIGENVTLQIMMGNTKEISRTCMDGRVDREKAFLGR